MGEVETCITIDGSSAFMTSFSGPLSDGGSGFGVRSLSRRGFVTAGTFGRIELARRRVPDDGTQPIRDIHPAARMLSSGHCAKRWSNTHKPANRREHCQHRERHPHRRR